MGYEALADLDDSQTLPVEEIYEKLCRRRRRTRSQGLDRGSHFVGIARWSLRDARLDKTTNEAELTIVRCRADASVVKTAT